MCWYIANLLQGNSKLALQELLLLFQLLYHLIFNFGDFGRELILELLPGARHMLVFEYLPAQVIGLFHQYVGLFAASLAETVMLLGDI